MKLVNLVILVSVISLSSSEENSRKKTAYNLVSKRQAASGNRKFAYSRASPCRKMDFYVNFFELGWDKWIIYPKVFNAHICRGTCALPLTLTSRKRKQNSSSSSSIIPSLIQVTNHAQIMSILEYKHPETNRQMTKCVSTKLKPLTVIFLDDLGRIKTKQYQDMIVEECGCR